MITARIDDLQEQKQPDPGMEFPPFIDRGEGYCDGWKPITPSDPATFDLDCVIGEIFADQAVKYARAIKNPEFISFVTASILKKAADGQLIPGGLESGFMTRLARLAYVGSAN